MSAGPAPIVGIDPGEKTGVSASVGSSISIAQIHGDDLRQITGVVQGFVGRGATFVIEDQMMKLHGPEQKTNFKALKSLMRRRFAWETLCWIYGVSVVFVYPSTWQGAMLRSAASLGPDGSKRTTKARALEVAAHLWPAVKGWTEHTADAALIARWYQRKQALENPEF